MKFQVDPRVLPLLLKIPHSDQHQLCLLLHETVVAQMYPLPEFQVFLVQLLCSSVHLELGLPHPNRTILSQVCDHRFHCILHY